MADRPPNQPDEKPEMYREGELPAEHQEALKRFHAQQAEAEAVALFEAYHRGPEALRRFLTSNDDAEPPNSPTSQAS